MCDGIDQILQALRGAVARFDASSLPGPEAARLVELLAESEKLSAAWKTLALKRVQTTMAWRDSGERSAARWLARRTGGTIRDACASLETSLRLDEAPATRAAFVAGKLSAGQAAQISAAVAADPAAEPGLLRLARRESFGNLKEACRTVAAAVAADEDAAERIRRGRYLRGWVAADGAVCVDGRFAPEDGARLLATVRARASRLEDEARRSGHRERSEAYAADALLELLDGHPGPNAIVHVEVDAAALERGHTEPGETCRIPGVGPIPVAVARRLAGAGSIKLIGRDGADVTSVVHLGRTIPARIRTALEARDPACVVPGCETATGLEIDHIVPFSMGGTTSLANLARLCRWHHAQKTHHGWVLGGAPSDWTLDAYRAERRDRARPSHGRPVASPGGHPGSSLRAGADARP